MNIKGTWMNVKAIFISAFSSTEITADYTQCGFP